MQEGAHSIILQNRKTLEISGITDVDRFDEREIVLYTQQGELTIIGRELHISAVCVETGKLSVDGDIWSLCYGDRDKLSPLSFLGRLLR